MRVVREEGAKKFDHINTKVHAAVNENGLPVKVLITSGTVADCSKAIELIDGLEGDIVIVDKGYDSAELVEFIEESGMYTSTKKQTETEGLQQSVVQTSTSCREFFLKIETMAWNRMQICQKCNVISSYD